MKHASKRIIAMLITVVMILGILPLASAANVGPFTDVQDSEWYADYVEYVYDNDLMNGMSDETFEPNSTCTRAMAATVLYRIDGENEVDEEASFDDLEAEWYMDAVAWAEYEGVVNGVGEGKFNPDGLVTREQLVTMIWRYAGEETPEDDEGIDEFDDADDVSEYAIDAFNWGIENGIINGKGDILDPAGNATRAEFAKIISIYDELREDDDEEEDPSEEDPSEEDPSEEDPSEDPSADPTTPSEDPDEPKETYVAIYNDAKGKAMTTDSSEYTSSTSGITKKQLGSADATLNADGKLETAATNVALFKMETVDGVTSFITADGKYLSCDGTDLAIVDAASDNTEFVLEETDGGYFIRLANFLYQGSKSQYIEFYANVFTSFGMGTDTSIYTFTFREVVGANIPDGPSDDPSAPSSDDFVLSSTIKAGDEVIIVCGARNIAFSSDKSGAGSYYNAGVEVAPVDGKITNAPAAIVWTVGEKDGYYTFSFGGQNIAQGADYASTNLGEINDTWALEEALTEGAYYIKNVGREEYLQWYEEKTYWSCFYDNSNEELYAMSFYVKGAASSEPGEDPSEDPTTPSEEPTVPAIPTEGYVAIYNDANGKVMTNEVSEYTSSSTGITKKQFASAAASLSAEGNLITEATNVPLFKIETVDGVTSFVTEDGKYLSCDGTDLAIVDAASDNTEFVIEETEGGYFIRLANFLYNGVSAQYIEFYRDVFTCYGMGADTTIYTFTFRALAGEGEEPSVAPTTPSEEDPSVDPTTPSAPPAEGYVAIYNDANGKVMTSEISTYTSSSGTTKDQFASAAASLSAEGNLITDATNVLLFKVETYGNGITSFITADGKYLSCDGTNMALVDSANENTEFVLEANGNGYFIRLANFLYNGTSAQYIEFYRDVFTCYGMGADTSIYTFSFRAMAAEGEEPTEIPTVAPTEPPAPIDGAEPVNFADLKNGDVIAIVMHTSPEMTNKDFVLLNNFAADPKVNAAEFGGTFDSTMTWTVKIVDGKVYLTVGDVGLYAIDNNNGLRADGEAAAITMVDGYLSLSDPSGNVRYIGVYDNNMGDMSAVSSPNFRCYKNTTNNTKNQTTTLYKIG